jgi:hypothetical protein
LKRNKKGEVYQLSYEDMNVLIFFLIASQMFELISDAQGSWMESEADSLIEYGI